MNKNRQFQNKKTSHLDDKSSRIKNNDTPNRYEALVINELLPVIGELI